MHNGNDKNKKSRKSTDLLCLEKSCRCKFYNKQLFISHLKFDHHIDFDIRCLNFISEEGNTFYLNYNIIYKIHLFKKY